MPTKNTTRTVWVLVIAVVAAFFLYISFAGRTPQPQTQDEFPSEETPPST